MPRTRQPSSIVGLQTRVGSFSAGLVNSNVQRQIILSKVTYIQRINTKGCDALATERERAEGQLLTIA